MEPKLPGAGTQASNAVGAILQTARTVLTTGGIGRLPPERVALRLAVCKACPSGLYRESDGKCAHCGCKMSMKTMLEQFDCPKGHWSGINPDSSM